MIRALLSLACCALLAPQLAHAEDACPPIERTAGPPVYAILYGYPHDGPVEGSWFSLGNPRPDLPMVDDDLVRMARLFRALGPERMRIHGEPDRAASARLSSFGVRPPTWRSLLESVAEVASDIDKTPTGATGADVYIYLAGHGRKGRIGDKTRLLIFGEPDGEAPGYNGVIDSALFAEHILTPLAARARVHLVADVCFAYTLLQTRQMKKVETVVFPPPEVDYVTPFSESFPDVGMQLASRSVTLEDPTLAGLFSHALRSAAIGPADADRDGVITYGEMDRALAVAARADRRLRKSTVVAPDGDPNTPFLRWRQSPAAQVCVAPGAVGDLQDGSELFATLPGFLRPTSVWLSLGHTFTARGLRLEAVDGARSSSRE